MFKIFKVLGDPVRFEIINLLKENTLNAGEIAANFDLTSATISYHLKVLKENDLIIENKIKNNIYYQVNFSIFEELLYFLKKGYYDEKK